MKPVAVVVAVVVVVPALFALAAPHRQPLPSRAAALPSDSAVRAIITQRVPEKRSAGIVVGLLDADGHTRVIAFGDAGPGRPPLDASSVFEIGSITKVFTATVLAELVQEGKVSLADPVQKYLPATVHVPTKAGKQITLGNLSEQNSGLPRLPDNLHPKDEANPYADYTVAQLYAFLSSYTLPRAPGASFEYSNLGVGLLGHALSLATGKPYGDLVHERVLEPVGMTHTGIALTPWMKDHLALGHDQLGRVTENWDFPTLAGAGALRSTVEDMLKFLAANLDSTRGPLERAMAFAHRPRAPADDGLVGLNWFTQQTATDTIVWHNGGTGGYTGFIGFEPSKKVGVVVLTNSGGEGPDDIGFHLLDPSLPLIKQRTAVDVAPAILERYVGVYALSPQFQMTVRLEGSALTIQATGQPPFHLSPSAETEFFVKELDAQITFVRDASGAATALVLHQGGADQTAKKVR